MVEQIKEILDNDIRPALQSDGGDIEFISYEDNIVNVKLVGACAGCPMSQMTLTEGVERTLMNRIPEIKGVQNLTM